LNQQISADAQGDQHVSGAGVVVDGHDPVFLSCWGGWYHWPECPRRGWLTPVQQEAGVAITSLGQPEENPESEREVRLVVTLIVFHPHAVDRYVDVIDLEPGKVDVAGP
jgi:hypothetical protein